MSKQVQPGMVIRLPDSKRMWMVTNASMGGGGWGHGHHDIYPDAWQVDVQALDPNSHMPNPKVSRRFHQMTNCYSNTFLEVEVIGALVYTSAKIVPALLKNKK